MCLIAAHDPIKESFNLNKDENYGLLKRLNFIKKFHGHANDE